MATILLGYELGTGYGHAARVLTLALELRRRGHNAVLAVNDLSKAETVLGQHGFSVFQAPLWLSRVGGLPPAGNYTDIMMRFGFLDPAGLLGMAKAWRNLLQLLKPSLLVLDHSPAALFATSGLGLPRARCGNGFACPPLATPMPSFHWWSENRSPYLEMSEREVLKVANQVRGELNQGPAGCVAELITAEQDFVCAFPETDHYPGRASAGHWGPILETGEGARVAWPAGPEKRVFAYVRPEFPFVKELADGLHAAGCIAILHVPGLAPAVAARLTTSRVVFSAPAVCMRDMCRECDLAVFHAGDNTTNAMLLAGKPMLLLPSQTEQDMLARRVEALGAAIAATAQNVAPDFVQLLRRLLDDPRFSESSRSFAAAHASYDVRETVIAVAQRCEELLT